MNTENEAPIFKEEADILIGCAMVENKVSLAPIPEERINRRARRERRGNIPIKPAIPPIA